MRVYRGRILLGLGVAAAVVVSGIAASTASAVLQTLPNGQTVSYQPLRSAQPSSAAGVSPFDSVFGNMDYNGGALMPSNTDYLVFWSPKGFEAYSEKRRRENASERVPEYVSGIAEYLAD